MQCNSFPIVWPFDKAAAHIIELIFVIKDAPEGGYTARALGQSIVTEADDIEALHRNVREAVHCHFEDAAVPKVVRLRFVREDVIAG